MTKRQVVMVGAFPPPVHGMAAVNAAVKLALQRAGVGPLVIDLASPSITSSVSARLARLPRVFRGLMRFAGIRRPRNYALYISVSGGLGQIHEMAFLIVARLHGIPIFLHHHSYAYLDRFTLLARFLAFAAGPGAIHVALSPRMSDRLTKLYGIERTIAVSNAALLAVDSPTISPLRVRRTLRTLGFLSNISYEKGILEFLALLDAARVTGLPVCGRLAGPFKDRRLEKLVRAMLARLPNVAYVGPQYGADKDAFFSTIDTLVFPTRYINEAEPLTVHEAMRHGIPVITYARGCITEIVSSDCGSVIDPGEPFVPHAMAKINAWLSKPSTFEAACSAAAQRFTENRAKNQQRLRLLLTCLTEGNAGHALQGLTGTDHEADARRPKP